MLKKLIYEKNSIIPCHKFVCIFADIIDDGFCVSGCHFYDDPPAPIDYVDIWVLD